MAFSRAAVKRLVEQCRCGAIDDPDDMILGMCARHYAIPIAHSAAFHQARPIDYDEEYLKRIPAISFHKFDDVDPYAIYMDYLYEPMTSTTNEKPKATVDRWEL